MKSILVVVENEVSVKPMLVKSMMFSPENIQVVILGNSDVARVQATLDEVTDKQCKTEIITNANSLSLPVPKAVSKIVDQINPDMVVIHRPQIGSVKQEYSLVKAVLQSTSHSTVLLCGDNKWKSKMKLLATLDMVDESSFQKLLNSKVKNVAFEVSKKIQAELAFLSIVEVSRVREELDIAIDYQFMEKDVKAVKAKLMHMINTDENPTVFPTHVSIGVPSKEITSVSQKLKSNLVVMGNVGRTGIKGLIVGNTAEKILDRLAVDALIVKT